MNTLRATVTGLCVLLLAMIPLGAAAAAPVTLCDNTALLTSPVGGIKIPAGSQCAVVGVGLPTSVSVPRGAELVLVDATVQGIRGVGEITAVSSYVKGDIAGDIVTLVSSQVRGGTRSSDLIAVDSTIGRTVNVSSNRVLGPTGLGAVVVDSTIGGDLRQSGGLATSVALVAADVAGLGSIRQTGSNAVVGSRFGRGLEVTNTRTASALVGNSVVGNMSVSRQSATSGTALVGNSVTRQLLCYANSGTIVAVGNTAMASLFDCAPTFIPVAEAAAATAQHGGAASAAAQSRLDGLAAHELLDAEAVATITAARDEVAAAVGQ